MSTLFGKTLREAPTEAEHDSHRLLLRAGLVTQNAAEALHLEATLVKRHQPFFNVRLKDDKHYPYLRVDVQNDWPRVEIARRVGNDGARYFGPYASASSVRRTLGVVKKLFPWRSCTKAITGTDPRPCLDLSPNCSGARRRARPRSAPAARC